MQERIEDVLEKKSKLLGVVCGEAGSKINVRPRTEGSRSQAPISPGGQSVPLNTANGSCPELRSTGSQDSWKGINGNVAGRNPGLLDHCWKKKGTRLAGGFFSAPLAVWSLADWRNEKVNPQRRVVVSPRGDMAVGTPRAVSGLNLHTTLLWRIKPRSSLGAI